MLQILARLLYRFDEFCGFYKMIGWILTKTVSFHFCQYLRWPLLALQETSDTSFSFSNEVCAFFLVDMIFTSQQLANSAEASLKCANILFDIPWLFDCYVRRWPEKMIPRDPRVEQLLMNSQGSRALRTWFFDRIGSAANLVSAMVPRLVGALMRSFPLWWHYVLIPHPNSWVDTLLISHMISTK